MEEEKKDAKSKPDDARPPIVRVFEKNKAKTFEEKINDPKSNDPFIKGILDISKDLPESPKPQ